MTTYKYTAVITGTIESEHDVNAKLQVLMGISLSMRLLQSEHDIAVRVAAPENVAEEPLAPTPIKANTRTKTVRSKPRKKGSD